MRTRALTVSPFLASWLLWGIPIATVSATAGGAAFSRDTGGGIPTSIFGTYIEPGQLLVYPYFEYSRDRNQEYQPGTPGLPKDQTLRARYESKEWNLMPGLGVARGLGWGTVTFQTTVEYTRDDHALNLGETAIEYLRRLSPSSRLYSDIEGGEGGGPDEWVWTAGLQYRIEDGVVLNLDNGAGLMSKANDWALRIGVQLTFSP